MRAPMVLSESVATSCRRSTPLARIARVRDVMRWTILFVLLAGCRVQPPPPPSIADLHFPVAVIFGNASVVLFKDAGDLGIMQIGNLNTVTGPPSLIDSTFAIYSMVKLGSTHNGLWLMAHPTGPTPVTFELERASKTGIEAARELMKLRLDEQTWRTDIEQKRRALTAEQTLPGMVTIVQGGGG